MNTTRISNLSARSQTLLEQALHGESDTTKARVLQLVLDAGINPEEEFFLISLGLNQLKVLLLDAPRQLNNWSSTLQEELDSWASSYTQLLQVIAQKADATSALTETAGQLAEMLTSHTKTTNALIRQLQVSHQAWGNSWGQQSAVNDELTKHLTSLSDQLSQQNSMLAKQLEKLTIEVKTSKRSDPLTAMGLSPDNGWKRAVFYGTAFCLTVGAMAACLMAAVYLRDRSIHQNMAVKVEYLLEKQNRRDCMDGIKLHESPECQSSE